VTWRRIDRF